MAHVFSGNLGHCRSHGAPEGRGVGAVLHRVCIRRLTHGLVSWNVVLCRDQPGRRTALQCCRDRGRSGTTIGAGGGPSPVAFDGATGTRAPPAPTLLAGPGTYAWLGRIEQALRTVLGGRGPGRRARGWMAACGTQPGRGDRVAHGDALVDTGLRPYGQPCLSHVLRSARRAALECGKPGPFVGGSPLRHAGEPGGAGVGSLSAGFDAASRTIWLCVEGERYGGPHGG